MTELNQLLLNKKKTRRNGLTTERNIDGNNDKAEILNEDLRQRHLKSLPESFYLIWVKSEE